MHRCFADWLAGFGGLGQSGRTPDAAGRAGVHRRPRVEPLSERQRPGRPCQSIAWGFTRMARGRKGNGCSISCLIRSAPKWPKGFDAERHADGAGRLWLAAERQWRSTGARNALLCRAIRSARGFTRWRCPARRGRRHHRPRGLVPWAGWNGQAWPCHWPWRPARRACPTCPTARRPWDKGKTPAALGLSHVSPSVPPPRVWLANSTAPPATPAAGASRGLRGTRRHPGHYDAGLSRSEAERAAWRMVFGPCPTTGNESL